MQITSKNDLKISTKLFNFINEDVLPGLNINSDEFWAKFSVSVHELEPLNKKLLKKREEIQKKIDEWHLEKRGEKFNKDEYTKFLKSINYIVKEKEDFKIETSDVDKEISSIAGAQLVVPIDNARYALNAANARWGSLYDALYGTDVIPEDGGAKNAGSINPARAKKVVEYSKKFLDETFPIDNGSWKNITNIKIENKHLVASIQKSTFHLKDQSQFKGYSGDEKKPKSILLKNNNLHCDILIDAESSVGKEDTAGISNIILESAISTIIDHEDSVAAVDDEDKVKGYKNWLGLMKGTLETLVKKNGKKFTRKLEQDRFYKDCNGKEFKLHGRALLLNRNVGHLMTNPSIVLKNGSEIPEGIMDSFFTVLCAMHDFKNKKNSRTGSVYIVKPKMHGPEETEFTDLIFSKVEEVLELKTNTIKVGLMDEERRTSANLKECIRALSKRIVFQNTGFLDRTGDEMHTSMEAGPMIKKGEMKSSKWILAYENNNVDLGLKCGFSGKAQIGKGMWATPDEMKKMLDEKIGHLKSGANCAWVPSPTAASLHALHYHQIDVFEVQKKLASRAPAKLNDLLTIPIADRPNWSVDEINSEISNSAQTLLGYVVRWIDQGVGCSKVPDISNTFLMEDRATLRISSQHIANWLHHGITTKIQVTEIMKQMAKVVDKQNEGDKNYVKMSDNFEKSIAFKAACDLIFKGKEQPSGYTEPLLHLNRLEKKASQN